MTSPSLLLKQAIPLIKTHGFTRTTLSLAGVCTFNGSDTSPLSDTAITALFGRGDEARKTLARAWLKEGLEQMGNLDQRGKTTIPAALKQRLKWNEDVLQFLPEAFALLAIPSSPLPVLNLISGLSHSVAVAQRACILAGDTSIGTTWYTRNIPIAGIYAAAELHQLSSPSTATSFLDSLFEKYRTVDDGKEYANYILRSLKGIAKSRGIL